MRLCWGEAKLLDLEKGTSDGDISIPEGASKLWLWAQDSGDIGETEEFEILTAIFIGSWRDHLGPWSQFRFLCSVLALRRRVPLVQITGSEPAGRSLGYGLYVLD